jgi:hypothetical protein
MELSFSSEREDYDDDPTAAAAATGKSNQKTFRPGQGDDEEDESQPPKKQAAAASKQPASKPPPSAVPLVPLKPAQPISVASEPKQPTGWSLFGSSNKEEKPTSSKPSVVSNTVTVSSEAAEIQAFDPADMEQSISRRSSTSISTKRKRAEKKAPIAQKKQDDFAPGAIGDMSDRGGKPAALKAAQKPSAPSKPAGSSDYSNGSAANKSMLVGLERKGGKGAFAPSGDLDFSADEDEEGAGVRGKKAKKDKGDPADKKDAASGSQQKAVARPAGHQADVAPLIQPVALDFVLRRWLVTILGGVQLTWSAKSSDESMPGVPGKIQAYQLLLLVYPAIICVIFHALRFHDVISPIGLTCLISGALCALVHLLVHLAHRRVLTKRPGTGTKVADSSRTPVGGSVAAKHDNYELELQQLVKAQAKRDGTLVKPVKKAKTQKNEDEDDASLPPGMKRPAKPAHDEDDDDDAGVPALDANTPMELGIFSPAVQRFILGPMPRSVLRIFIHAFVVGVVCAGATFFLDWTFIARQYDFGVDLSSRGIVYLVFAWLSFVLSLYAANVRAPAAEPAKWSEGGWWEEAVYLPFGRIWYVAIVIAFNLALRLIAESNHGVGADNITQAVLDIHSQVLYLYLFLPVFFTFGVLPPLDALLWWSAEQLHVVFFAIGAAANSTRTAFFLLTHTAAAFVVFIVWLHSNHSSALCFSLGLSFFLAWNILPLSIGASVKAGKEDGLKEPDQPYAGWKSYGWQHLGVVTVVKFLLVLGCLAAGVILAGTDNDDFLHSIQTLHSADIAFDLVALAFLIALYVLSEVYQPYIFFSQLKNPFYKRFVLQAGQLGSPAKESTRKKHIAFNWLVRAFLVVYITFHQDPYVFDGVTSARTTVSDHGKLTLFAYAVCLLRCFNQMWSSHFAALQHVCILVVINLITEAMDTTNWTSLDWSVRFLIVGFVWQRFRYDFLPKLWFWCVLTHSSFTVPKLAMRNPGLMKAICLLLIPYHLAVIAFSSFLCSPILPLLGSPILLLGFPRPQRTWRLSGGKYGMNVEAASGEVGNGGADTVFYQQQFPEIHKAIQAALLEGPLTYTFSTGDFFLLRSEPYLIWCSILEKGLSHVVIQMKGLELQTTSCHTVEALRIDEVVDSVLDKSNSIPTRSALGVSFAYSPQLTLEGIRSFSITKTSLAGIIEDLENLRLVSRAFLRCIMLNVKRKMDGRGMKALPPHWTKPTVSAYDLQQLEEASTWPQSYAWHLFADTPLSQEDSALFKKVCLSIYAVVETLGSDVVSGGGKRTPTHVINVFGGKIATSLYSDYLLVDNAEAKELKQLTIDSYRVAVKAMYDCAALASLEIIADDTPEQFSEWQNLLAEYESDWYINVVPGNPTWERLVSQGTKKMFTVAKASNEANKYTSLTLEMSKMTLKLCTLSPTAIRSMWSSLSMELFYSANDDDESFLRQAHPQLLRNLTVQTAEPPLGYCVFSSLPTILNAP